MEHFVGLDVSQEMTNVCVVDRDGTVIWRGACLSTPEDIALTVRAKAPAAVRIGLETGPLATWHWHALKKKGLPVICIDARHAKSALSMQANKTDRNDAFGLAQIMRTGWYREVGVKSSGKPSDARRAWRSGTDHRHAHRDNTEVIRYLITIDVPFSGHLLAQER